MVVKAHVLRFSERCFNRVITGRFVLRVPLGDGWTSDDVQAVTVFLEFGAVQRQSRSFLFGIDLSGPTRDRDSASLNSFGNFLSTLREVHTWNRYNGKQSEGKSSKVTHCVILLRI
jgi:hypothetical protein